MRTIHRKLYRAALIAAFAVALVAVLHQRAFAANASTVFSPVAASLTATAQFTVLLPTYLPDYMLDVSTGSTAATVVKNTPTQYQVVVGSPNCPAATYCTLAEITGSSTALSLAGTATSLSNGAIAYFVPAKCTVFCAQATLTWRYGSAYYEVGIKNANSSDLSAVANSMSTY